MQDSTEAKNHVQWASGEWLIRFWSFKRNPSQRFRHADHSFSKARRRVAWQGKKTCANDDPSSCHKTERVIDKMSSLGIRIGAISLVDTRSLDDSNNRDVDLCGQLIAALVYAGRTTWPLCCKRIIAGRPPSPSMLIWRLCRFNGINQNLVHKRPSSNITCRKCRDPRLIFSAFHRRLYCTTCSLSVEVSRYLRRRAVEFKQFILNFLVTQSHIQSRDNHIDAADLNWPQTSIHFEMTLNFQRCLMVLAA